MRTILLCGRLFTLEPTDGFYSAVVCTGSTAFYPGKVAARRRGIPVAAILYPRGYRLDFDCILAPSFDRPPSRPNLVTLPINLTSTNTAFYEAGVAAFRARHPAQAQEQRPHRAAVHGLDANRGRPARRAPCASH